MKDVPARKIWVCFLQGFKKLAKTSANVDEGDEVGLFEGVTTQISFEWVARLRAGGMNSDIFTAELRTASSFG